MFPLIVAVLHRDYRTPSIIPIKDYGNIPSLGFMGFRVL